MEMKKINSGKLRAIGYDARARILQAQFDDGSTLQYSGVGEDVWRRLSSSGSAWSYYRDNIEEEFTVKRIFGNPPAGTGAATRLGFMAEEFSSPDDFDQMGGSEIESQFTGRKDVRKV